MTTRKKRGGRREPPGGAPRKGHVRLVCYVQPETRRAIDEEAERDDLTLGQVIDRWLSRQGDQKPFIDEPLTDPLTIRPEE